MSDQATTPTSITLENGRQVAIREFKFVDGLKLTPYLQPLIEQLDKQVGDGGGVAGVVDVIYSHPDALREMLLIGTDLEQQDIEDLTTQDGDALVLAVWAANAEFFVRRIATRRAIREAATQHEEGEG